MLEGCCREETSILNLMIISVTERTFLIFLEMSEFNIFEKEEYL